MSLRQGQPNNVCFYSNKCEWSEAFLKELAKTSYRNEFQFVCIDTTPRAELPNWLKQVPTLLVRDDKEPIKVNSEVMNWLYERKMRDNQAQMPRGPMPAGSGGPGGPAGSASDEPEAWNMAEMGGKLSESYGSLVEGSGASVDNSSTKNFDFSFLNGNSAQGDRSAQGIGSSSVRQEPSRTKSKKEEMFDRQMEEYTKNRDNGLPQRRAAPNGGRI
jgi:hypothetical protein